MKRYTGIPCAHCGEKFKDTDDVVVCPICGAPHHRACYLKVGNCARADKHASGEVWQPPGTVSTEGRGEAVICPNCSSPNPKQSQYCQMCGTKLHEPYQMRREPVHEGSFTPPPGTVYTGNVDNTDQWEIGGVTAREMSTYIGNNSHYYLRQFRQMQLGATQWSWNWSAFFFGPFYFFYRRLYAIGALFLAITVVLSIPTLVYTVEFAKMTAPEYGGVATAYNAELMDLMATIQRYLQFVSYTLMGVRAMFANRFYMKKVLGDIKEIREKMPKEAGSREYYAQLYFAGRPDRMTLMISVMALVIAFSFFSRYVAGIMGLTL